MLDAPLPAGAVTLLPERARALGAPANWLGQIAVGEAAAVERAAGRLVELGGERLGPLQSGADGVARAVVRDPLGSVLALGTPAAVTSSVPVAWFAWDGDGPSVGAMIESVRLPAVHPHWLYHFAVRDLDAALATVRSLGGTVSDELATLPTGARVAACEDAQRAAFALQQSV